LPPPSIPAHFPYTTLFRSAGPSKGSGTDYDYAVVKYFQPQPPVIVTQPASQNVNAATTVVFSVVAQGTAPLLYQWRLNGVNLPGDRKSTRLNSSHVSISYA